MHDRPLDPLAPIRGEVRDPAYYRVSHGLFRRVQHGLDPDTELERDLAAWLLVLPPGACFTHVTAARLLGWQLPALPEQVPVFAAVHGDVRRPRRPGLICSRLVRPEPEGRVVRGLPVDALEEILLRASRDLGHLDLLVMIDSARRLGHLEPDALERLLASGRPGVRPLRAAWRASSDTAESAGETMLRRFHDLLEVPVEPQAMLTDPDGVVVGRADLLLVGTREVHEYDGAGHRGARQHRVDLRRERGLAAQGYVRSGFTLDDLLNHAGTVMHEIDRKLGRPHRASRLSRWRSLVEHSLYAEPCRRRVINRWQRQMGVVDWARTA
ncbi:MAG: hypothetical protein ACXVD1_09260 [Nocardioides sp.]